MGDDCILNQGDVEPEKLGVCGHDATNDVLYNGAPCANYRVLICDNCLRTKLFSKNILEIKKIEAKN